MSWKKSACMLGAVLLLCTGALIADGDPPDKPQSVLDTQQPAKEPVQSTPAAGVPPDNRPQVSPIISLRDIKDIAQSTSSPERGVYCEPCYSNVTDDWITNVTFCEINHTTGAEGAPCSYGDYTNLVATVAAGSTYTLSVSFDGNGTWTEHVRAWFDWNQDYVFDTATESYYIGSGVCDPGFPVTVSADIDVPGDALQGATRMRVIEKYNADPTDPCESSTYGEGEDYGVMVGEAPPYGACCVGPICDPNMPEADCLNMGGEYQGDGTDCVPNPCVGACCFPDGSCLEMTEDDCLATPDGAYEGDGTDCDPNPCPQPGPPNDWCADAEPIGDVIGLPFDTTLATTDGIDTHSVNQDIWYCYTASCSGELYVGLCASSFDTKVVVYDTCDCSLVPGSELCYNDDSPCANPPGRAVQSECWVGVIAGNEYLIQVGGYGSYAGPGALDVVCTEAPTGACCIGQDCFVLTEVECVYQGGTYLGDGTDCGPPNPCLTGACCFLDGSCQELSEGDCFAAGGVLYQGNGTVCDPNPCPVPCDCNDPVDVYPYCEDWETGFGLWTQSLDDDFDWTRQTGPTGSSGTGPSAAHGGSYYIYTESSSPNYPDKTAILVGPCFDLTPLTQPALTFWYHMYGAEMGTLSVEVSNTYCILWDTVWSASGDHGDIWLLAQIDLSAYAGADPVIVRFVGLTGSSFTSDMAIDDVCVDEYTEFLGACCDPVTGDCYPDVSEADCEALYGPGNWLIATGCGPPNPCPQPPPPNDDCVNATPIGDVVDLWWDTTSATFDGGGTCMSSNNIWYCYTATCYGNVTVSLCGDPNMLFDTKLAVYETCECSPLGLEIECNDDFCGYQSQITFAAVQGNQYLIEVGGYSSLFGPGVLNIWCDPYGYGACCVGGLCTEEYDYDCAVLGGIFGGDGTTCNTGDCNANGRDDTCDILEGISQDCQPNNIPDECDIDPTDPDGNGEVSDDYNSNGIPDECDPDCNGNGVPDDCDLDCTVGNCANHPGGCGGSCDCQGDGIPDECQLGGDKDRDCDLCIYDDGTTENGLGLTNGGEICWISHCTGSGTIGSICTVWGYTGGTPGVNPGDPVRVFVWADPNGDGNPDDAVFLAEGNDLADAASIGTDVFQEILIGPVNVPDSYFIGASAVHPAGSFPCPMDEDGPQAGESWLGYVVGGTYDPNQPGGQEPAPLKMSDIGYPCNWLIRAGAGAMGGDCNNNGIPDECDLPPTCQAGQPCFPDVCSDDYNQNGVPDECDPDCNGNGVPDDCDIDCTVGNCAAHPGGCGTSPDCQPDGIPDECQVPPLCPDCLDCQPDGIPDECQLEDNDCQPNGVPDECDIADGTSLDVDGNGVPDECQEDCNGNGILDGCDVSCDVGDCAIVYPDDCGLSCDCQGDMIPDECQIGGRGGDVLFDNGPLITDPGAGAGGADVSALQTSIGGNVYGYGAQLSAGFRIADDFTLNAGASVETITVYAYQTGSSTSSTISQVNMQIWDGSPDDPASSVVWGDTSTNVMIATDWSGIYRTLDTDLLASNRPIMECVVQVDLNLDAGTYWLDYQFDGTLTSGPWAPPVTRPLTPGTGNALQWTGAWAPVIDSGGLWPDDFPFIIAGSAGDCNENGIPDECDVPPLCPGDPNDPCFPPVCSEDCQPDGIPDECQLEDNDCNLNGIPDDCDIASGFSQDCQPDGIPDECQLAGNDCNGNLVPDECDIASGTSQDCQPNGIPDECDVDPTDPDGNGEVSDDCQPDGIPDECQLWDEKGRQCTNPDATVTIEIFTDDYPSETSWDIVERDVGVVDSIAPGSLTSPQTLYTWDVPVCSTGACYDFTIYDVYGDGICCSYGNGYYNVLYEGNLIATGGVFGFSETVRNLNGDPACVSACFIEQPPNQVNGIFSDTDCGACGTGIQILAEQFVLDAEGHIGVFRFWGGYHPGNVSQDPDPFTVLFRDDAAGLPGNVISQYGPMAAFTKETTGVVLFGVDEYVYTILVDETLGAGTYWVEVYNDTVGNSDSWFWETGNLDPDHGIPGQAWTTTLPEPPWNFDSATDMAFELCPPAGAPPNDCNENGVPDECDVPPICGDPPPACSRDCDGNLIPDECELCGDLDRDGVVDVVDYWIFLDAFGSCDPDVKYEPCADYEPDGCVTLVDYQVWLQCYRDANPGMGLPLLLQKANGGATPGGNVSPGGMVPRP